ncbi:MAG: DUF6488 family protein [Deltaproteobacteria bacterium]|nr:DUF6488 family protein [Deltaproteobacteria bacterium]
MKRNIIKRSFFIQVMAVMLFLPPLLFAHGDHDHPPLTDADFFGKATFDVSIIVDDKEPVEGDFLDESWKKIKEEDKKIVKKTENFVIVSFYNREKKRTLFVLLTVHVEYLGANFSGKFKGG